MLLANVLSQQVPPGHACCCSMRWLAGPAAGLWPPPPPSPTTTHPVPGALLPQVIALANERLKQLEAGEDRVRPPAGAGRQGLELPCVRMSARMCSGLSRILVTCAGALRAPGRTHAPGPGPRGGRQAEAHGRGTLWGRRRRGAGAGRRTAIASVAPPAGGGPGGLPAPVCRPSAGGHGGRGRGGGRRPAAAAAAAGAPRREGGRGARPGAAGGGVARVWCPRVLLPAFGVQHCDSPGHAPSRPLPSCLLAHAPSPFPFRLHHAAGASGGGAGGGRHVAQPGSQARGSNWCRQCRACVHVWW